MYKTKKSLHACTAASFIVLSKYSGDTVCKHNTRPRSCGRLGLAPSWGPHTLDPQDPSPHDFFFTPKSHSQMKSKAEGESSKIVLSPGSRGPSAPPRCLPSHRPGAGGVFGVGCSVLLDTSALPLGEVKSGEAGIPGEFCASVEQPMAVTF